MQQRLTALAADIDQHGHSWEPGKRPKLSLTPPEGGTRWSWVVGCAVLLATVGVWVVGVYALIRQLVCPGTVDERVEEVVAGKRRIADMVLPKASTVDDLQGDQLRAALGIDPDALLTEDLIQVDEEVPA